MKKRYLVKHKEVLFNLIEIDEANSDEDALRKAREESESDSYKGCNNFEEEEFTIVSSKVIYGTELKQEYVNRIDATIIIEYTYKGGDLVGEQIVGYYHGEPYPEGIKDYAYKGTYVNHAIFG